MSSSISNILDIEKLDNNLFRSRSHWNNFRDTLYGGQVLGQALIATISHLDGVLPHSLHAYFLRPGSSEAPVIYDVERIRDGNSFSSCRVVARQFGRPIFHMSLSFHREEEGYSHQNTLDKEIPSPEELLEQKAKLPKDPYVSHLEKNSPLDILPVKENAFLSKNILQPENFFWIKAREVLNDDPIQHFCALTFASDMGLLATALLPHPTSIFDKQIMAASIDHAMWFHSTQFRADDWLLCHTFSPWAGGARGFTVGSIYNRTGDLVASTTQEGLVRPKKPVETLEEQ